MMSNRKFGQGLAASGDVGQPFRAMVSCRKGQGLICVTSDRKVNILVGGMSSYHKKRASVCYQKRFDRGMR